MNKTYLRKLTGGSTLFDKRTRLITMRSKPDYVEFVIVNVVVVLIVVAVHKGLVVVDKSLSGTH